MAIVFLPDDFLSVKSAPSDCEDTLSNIETVVVGSWRRRTSYKPFKNGILENNKEITPCDYRGRSGLSPQKHKKYQLGYTL